MNNITDFKHLGDFLEEEALKLPQAECKLDHIFGKNLYIRQALMPEGAFVVGHHHKEPCMNVFIKGKMAIIKDDGQEPEIIEAPMTFISPAGRKIALMLEDCLWQNIHVTEETNIDKLEAMLYEKSDVALEYEKNKKDMLCQHS